MKRVLRSFLLIVLVLMVSGFVDCYRRAGQGNNLPKHIKTIAIPPFQNPSLRFKVEQRFTAAMIDEVLRRKRSLKVVSSSEGADAVIIGKINYFFLNPKLLDDLGRARLFEITIVIDLMVRDQTNNKTIFHNPNYTFRDEYEISSDPKTFFSEEGPAVDRVARDFAKSAITTMLEGF
jgi:Lipopolysaccharide-assembly